MLDVGLINCKAVSKGALTFVVHFIWQKHRHCCIFQLFWLLFTPQCLLWSESVDELVKQTKKCGKTSDILITHWPDVSWNIFTKLLFD